MSTDELSDKRKVFVAEYVKCLNATEAARRAEYANPNKMGPRLVKVGKIRTEIDRRLRSRILSADEVLSRLCEQAAGDYSQYVKSNGTVDLEALLDDGKGHLIKSLKWTNNGLNVEFYDSQKALSLMAKHRRLLDETSTQLNVDLNSLSSDQLERIIAGESPLVVVSDGPDDKSSSNDEPDEAED